MIRRLTVADLPACLDLTLDRGWPSEEPKWRLMFAVSEIYGIDDPSGGLSAVVGLTRYGRELAAVGMMLVATRLGRRGLGERLMRYVLEQAEGATVCLYATAMGQPLYERLGFRVVDVASRYTGNLVPARAFDPPADLRLVTASELGAIAALDERAFGAPRTALLSELAARPGRFAVCGEPATGYGVLWDNGEARVIGPVVAATEAVLPGLLDGLVAGRPGPVRIDVSSRHAELARWAEARGLSTDRQTAVMAYGGELPGERSWLFAPANVALG